MGKQGQGGAGDRALPSQAAFPREEPLCPPASWKEEAKQEGSPTSSSPHPLRKIGSRLSQNTGGGEPPQGEGVFGSAADLFAW